MAERRGKMDGRREKFTLFDDIPVASKNFWQREKKEGSPSSDFNLGKVRTIESGL